MCVCGGGGGARHTTERKEQLKSGGSTGAWLRFFLMQGGGEYKITLSPELSSALTGLPLGPGGAMDAGSSTIAEAKARRKGSNYK